MFFDSSGRRGTFTSAPIEMLSCCHSTSAVFHAGSVDFSFQLIKEDIEVVFSVFYLISFNYLLIRKKKESSCSSSVNEVLPPFLQNDSTCAHS